MNRSEARELARQTLLDLGLFQAVWQGAPDVFEGITPVAVITSRSLTLGLLTRGIVEAVGAITVSIYVRRDPGAGEAAEDALDALTLAVATALFATGSFIVAESSADVAAGNLRDVDRNGVVYRVERIPLTVFEDS